MIDPEHLKNFSKRLSEILQSELNSGNEIFETTKGWPTDETIMVFLKRPFHKTYLVEGIEYHDVNDPHYWKAEYGDEECKHFLACGFG